jgi:uncharacterized membrane protein YidH (DUF202 family)
MTNGDDYESDPRASGLAAERTLLAWNRTGLSFVAVGAGILRLFAGRGAAVQSSLVGAGTLAIGVLVIVLGRVAYAQEIRQRPSSAGRLRAVAYMNAGVAVLALVLAFT